MMKYGKEYDVYVSNACLQMFIYVCHKNWSTDPMSSLFVIVKISMATTTTAAPEPPTGICIRCFTDFTFDVMHDAHEHKMDRR